MSFAHQYAPALLLGGFLALQAVSPAVAPDSAAGTAPAVIAPPTTVAPVEARGNRKICVRTGSRAQVGSRIRDPAARTICKTRDEWITDTEDRRELLDKVFRDAPRPSDAIGGPTGGQAFDCRGAGIC